MGVDSETAHPSTRIGAPDLPEMDHLLLPSRADETTHSPSNWVICGGPFLGPQRSRIGRGANLHFVGPLFHYDCSLVLQGNFWAEKLCVPLSFDARQGEPGLPLKPAYDRSYLWSPEQRIGGSQEPVPDVAIFDSVI